MKKIFLFLVLGLLGCFSSENDLKCALNPAQTKEVQDFIKTVQTSIDYLSTRLEAARKIAANEVAAKFAVDMDITAGPAAAGPIGAGFDAQLTELQAVLGGDYGKFDAVKSFFTAKGLFAEEE